MLLVNEIITAVRVDLADVSATRWTDSQIVSLLNECLEELNIICHLNRKEYVGYISNGDKYLTKPDDLQLIDSIYIDNRKIDTLSQYDASAKQERWVVAVGNLQYVVDDYMPEYGLRLFPIPNNIIEPTILDGIELEITEDVVIFGLCLDKVYPSNEPIFGLSSINTSLQLSQEYECPALGAGAGYDLVQCVAEANNFGGVITDIKEASNCELFGALTSVEDSCIVTTEDFGAITGIIENNYIMYYISKFPVMQAGDSIVLDSSYRQGIVFYITYRLLENDSAYADLRLSSLKYNRYLAEIAKYKKVKSTKKTTGKTDTNSLYRGFE